MNTKIIVGKIFNRLTIIEVVKNSTTGNQVRCLCACGAEVIKLASNVAAGRTKSCGCLNHESLRSRSTHGCAKHGQITIEYSTWLGIKRRCYNNKEENYEYYGARGIGMCERWKDSFENFLIDMGPRPDGHSIDRIDSSLDYEPGNCRWSDAVTQANNRSCVIKYEFAGASMSITQWSRIRGLREGTLRKRIKSGWPLEKALMEPVRS